MSDLDNLLNMLEHHYNEREDYKSKAAQADLRRARLIEEARQSEDSMNAVMQRIQAHDDFGDDETLDIDPETGEVSIVDK
jgi:hypothetical protein